MDLMQAIRERHSYRSFTGEPVERDVIERVLAAAGMAPSALNAQPWLFHVLQGDSRKAVQAIMENTTVYLDDYLVSMGKTDYVEPAMEFATNFGEAPVVIAVSVPAPADEMAAVNTYVSAGCAIENLLLAATDAGLGACNVTFSYWVRDELGPALGLGDDRVVVTLVLLGKPASPPVAPVHEMDHVRWYD